MSRFWRQIIKGEEGQVLPVVLILLVVGGLIIAPTLNHVSTSLNAGRTVEENVRGIYAAESGVEDALWHLRNDPLASYPHPYQLPENVNQMQVEVEVSPTIDGKKEKEKTYTLYDGELKENKKTKYDWLAIDGERWEWDEEKKAYEYTIIVTWQADDTNATIVLLNVGARLPIGYEYKENSTADFEVNLSTDEPDVTQDWAGAYLLNWTTFDGDKHKLIRDDSVTLTFNVVTGEEEPEEEEPEGDYTWANSSQTGEVGEIIGTLYQITATATSDSGSSTTIEAYALVNRADEYDYYNPDFKLEDDETYYGNVYAEHNVKLEKNAILYGNAIAEHDVELKKEGATIDNGSVCAGNKVKLEKNATINGDVYAGGNVELKDDATINGDVYAGDKVKLEDNATINGDVYVYALDKVELKDDATITGEIYAGYEYERCGLSLNEGLQILSWQINPQEEKKGKK